MKAAVTDNLPSLAGNPALQSGVLTSPADPMLSRAIAVALAAPPADRAGVFASLVREIEELMAAHPEERPWICTVYSGTDGSTIFRGGVGHSLVIDAGGRLWRGRSYEDFETTYRFESGTCRIWNRVVLLGPARPGYPDEETDNAPL